MRSSRDKNSTKRVLGGSGSILVTGNIAQRTAYCTIIAANYLPQACSLYESLRRNVPNADFHLLVVDGERAELPRTPEGMSLVSLEVLGFAERERHNLAAIYDVVELSTAVKPRLLRTLLEDYDRAVYLDPDMWVVSAISELDEIVDEFGIVLTPHLLQPIEPGESFLSEVNTLTVGVHNLGFCAVGRAGIPFLDWWWSHLQRECLIYPLLGMFVDQKWTDIGSVMFSAHSLMNYGYNVGHWNLQERRFSLDEDGWRMEFSGEPLRLLHFSGFDPLNPDEISVRQNRDLGGTELGFDGFAKLGREYAEVLLEARRRLNSLPSYGWADDLDGRRLGKRLRRTYRQELVSGSVPPSPFRTEDRIAFRSWRRRAAGGSLLGIANDGAIALKYTFPDAYDKFRSRRPGQFGRLKTLLFERTKIRR
jgi:hypothetical protein